MSDINQSISDNLITQEILNVIRNDKAKAKFLKERLEGDLVTIYPFIISDAVIMSQNEQSLTQYIEDLIKDIDDSLVGDTKTLLNYYDKNDINKLLQAINDELERLGNEEVHEVFCEDIDGTNKFKRTTSLPNSLLANSKTHNIKL